MPAEGGARAGRLARRALLAAWISLCGACLLVLPTRHAPIVVEVTSRAVDGTGGMRLVLRGDGEGSLQAIDDVGAVLRIEDTFDLSQNGIDALHAELLQLCLRDHGRDDGRHDESDVDRALRRRVEERVLGERAAEHARVFAQLEIAFDDLAFEAAFPLVEHETRSGLGAYDRHALSLVDAVLGVIGARVDEVIAGDVTR